MNVHKICTHAALSLALVSSATSHGMGDNIPKAALIGGAVVAGAAVLVVGAKMAYWLGGLDATQRINLADESIKKKLNSLKQEAEFYKKKNEDLQKKYKVSQEQMIWDWIVLYEDSGAAGDELTAITDSTDTHSMNPMTNFIRALRPAAKEYNNKTKTYAKKNNRLRGTSAWPKDSRRPRSVSQ